MKFLICMFSIFAVSLSALLPAPYHSIELLPENTFGWYANRKMVDRIFREHEIRLVVEVGSWVGGGSTRHFGELLRAKRGLLYSVDTWLGSTTQQPGKVHHQPDILPHVYQQFLSNMIHWGLAETVIPVRMKSVEAARELTVQPDLIYIDGEHTADAVYEDLVAWYPFVEERGICCGDDWTWSSVREGIHRFVKERNLQVVGKENFWRIFRADEEVSDL